MSEIFVVQMQLMFFTVFKSILNLWLPYNLSTDFASYM